MNNNTATVSVPSLAIARLTAAVALINGPRFVGVTYRSVGANELARHTLIIGASYDNVMRESLTILRERANIIADASETRRLQALIKATATGTKERKAANAALATFQDSIGAERAAASELFVSYENTLTAHEAGEENEAYTKAGLYESICPGLNASHATGSIQLCGLAHSKTVIEAGVYKSVDSSAKTLAKKALTETLPAGKWRTFKVDAATLESVRIGGNEIDCKL